MVNQPHSKIKKSLVAGGGALGALIPLLMWFNQQQSQAVEHQLKAKEVQMKQYVDERHSEVKNDIKDMDRKIGDLKVTVDKIDSRIYDMWKNEKRN